MLRCSKVNANKMLQLCCAAFLVKTQVYQYFTEKNMFCKIINIALHNLRQPTFKIHVRKLFGNFQDVAIAVPQCQCRQRCSVERCCLDHRIVAKIKKYQPVADLRYLFESVSANDVSGETGGAAKAYDVRL